MGKKLFANIINNKYSWLYLLLSISIISVVLSYISNHLIITDAVYKESVVERFSRGKVQYIISKRFNYEWINYLLSPVFKLIPILIISLTILIGAYLNSYKIKFFQILNLITLLSVINLIPYIYKIWVFYNMADFSLQDYRNFSPHSLIYYLRKENLPKWSLYPIYLINIEKLLYCISLIIGIKYTFKINLYKSILLFIQTYFVLLLFWAVFISLIIILLS